MRLPRFSHAGTRSMKASNHFSFRASMESILKLKKLGYAARPRLATFGRDIVTRK